MNPAFAFLYDDFLAQGKFERDLSQLEAELAQRGIEGRVARLAMFRSARETIKDLAIAGVKNVVLVGNDKTIEKMMWFLPDIDITVGYIPLAPPAMIGELLGIPFGVAAVDVLAARLVETLDVGRLGDRYFLTEVVVPASIASLDVEGQYRVTPAEGGAIAIRNLGNFSGKTPVIADAKDGKLEAVIQTKATSTGYKGLMARQEPLEETRILFERGALVSKEPFDVFVDGHVVNGFSFPLSIVPKKLRVIQGRQRPAFPMDSSKRPLASDQKT